MERIGQITGCAGTSYDQVESVGFARDIPRGCGALSHLEPGAVIVAGP